jgi:2-oxoglutarate dehydrogenase E2 component (dihydrolipoamide succinyltransferase)
MKIEIKIPAMGESISEATVGEILKPAGSIVAMDEELLELETDKVNQVLYAPQAGVVELSVKTDDVVTIGQVIGYIDTSAKPENKPVPAAAPAKSEEKKAPGELPAKETPKKPVDDSQVTARLMKEDFVKTINDPAKHQEKPKTTEKVVQQTVVGERSESRVRMSRLRQVIAKRLVDVQQQTAMLTTFNEVDMTEVMELRKKYQDKFVKDHDVKLGFMSFFIKACVSALKVIPEVNAYIDDGDIVFRNYYDISVAVGTDKGLVVPVVRNCDHLSFAQIEQEIGDLAVKARTGKLTIEDLQGGGFTITNGGIYGSLLSTPIINPPQSAILGMHSIQKRPVVVNDQIVIRPMMYVALSYDHRIIDGKEAVSFLVHVKNTLEDPARLLLEV